MVEYDHLWLVKLIVGFDGCTHIRNLEFQTDDIGQIDIIPASRIGGDTPLCADRTAIGEAVSRECQRCDRNQRNEQDFMAIPLLLLTPYKIASPPCSAPVIFLFW